MNRRGFTVLEMLAAIGIAAVTLVILASATRSQGRSAIFQMGSADMQQNVRSALDLFTREVRMAGYGLNAVPTATLAPIEVLATADVYAVRLRGNYGNVKSRGSAAGSLVTLDPTEAPFSRFLFLSGEQLAIESLILGVAEVRTIAGYNPGTGVITLSIALGQTYEAGSPVNQIDSLDYRLDGAGVLWRGNDPMADQLNVLQLAYVLADGTTVADPAANLDTLRAATVRMHAQKPELNGLQPQAELGTEVRIRNLGIAAEAS
jgi:prepilin-type N-terminal cleavage/methylation domain-containing protein